MKFKVETVKWAWPSARNGFGFFVYLKMLLSLEGAASNKVLLPLWLYQDGVLLLIEPATNEHPPVYVSPEADENIAMDGSESTETVVEEAAGTSGSQYQHLTTKELYRLHLQREIAKADLQMEYMKLLIELAWANKEVETFVCILGEEDVVYDVYVAAAAIDIRPTTKSTVGSGNATSELSWAISPPPNRTFAIRSVPHPAVEKRQ
ncbi:unnamed protein product [Boreogadus saida]